MKIINIFVLIRVGLASIFIVSGFEKLTGPYQNFLYVIEGYDIFPRLLELFTAHTIPWVEFFIGIFLFLGLWTIWALRGFLLMVTVFIVIVSQAILRQLPITECGCFGELMSFPLHIVLLFDSCLFLLTAGLILKMDQSTSLSLDKYFSSK